MKKTLALLLVVLMSLSALACGFANAEGEETINITVWRDSKSVSGLSEIDYGSTKVGAMNVAKDKVNFVVHYVTGDVEADFNLKLADGNWEDVITMTGDKATYDIRLSKLIENDAVLDLTPYFNDPANYPNLAKIPKEALAFWAQPDGKIYSVPGAWHDEGAPIFWLAAGWYILPSIAEQVGIPLDSIKTMDDVKNYLIAVKNAGLKTADGLDVIPLSGGANLDGLRTVLAAYGLDTAGTGYAKIGDAWTHYRDTDQYKAALKFLNDLNRAGALDPEYTSITNDQLVERLMGSRVAMVVGNAWPFWSTVTAGETPVTKLDMLQFPKVEGVDKVGTLMTFNPYGSASVAVSKNTKYADRIMKWFDYYSETGKYRDWEALNGPIEQTWTWDEARGGEPYFKFIDEDIITAKNTGDYNQIEALGWQIASFLPSPYKYDLNEYTMDNEGLAWIFKMNNAYLNAESPYYVKIRPVDMVTIPADSPYTVNAAALKDVDLQYAASMIAAESDEVFEQQYTEYREQLEAKGKWSEVNAQLQELYKDVQ